MDKWTEENKNLFAFGYIECLVAWMPFHEITVLLLPMRHTRKDKDQAFICTSGRLWARIAIGLDDPHADIFNVYNKDTTIRQHEHIVSFADVCREQGCLGPFPMASYFRYFRFLRNPFPPIIFVQLTDNLLRWKESITEMIYCTNERSCYQKWKYSTTASVPLYCISPKYDIYSTDTQQRDTGCKWSNKVTNVWKESN